MFDQFRGLDQFEDMFRDLEDILEKIISMVKNAIPQMKVRGGII
jgi:hypothetical protein